MFFQLNIRVQNENAYCFVFNENYFLLNSKKFFFRYCRRTITSPWATQPTGPSSSYFRGSRNIAAVFYGRQSNLYFVLIIVVNGWFPDDGEPRTVDSHVDRQTAGYVFLVSTQLQAQRPNAPVFRCARPARLVCRAIHLDIIFGFRPSKLRTHLFQKENTV